MENSNKPILILSILILLAVLFSYFDLKTAIEQDSAENMQAVAGATITVGGIGDTITFNSGGGNCSPTSGGIKAEASISAGANGNTISVTAKCALGNTSASTTSTDPGTGLPDYTVANGNPGQGRASCDTSYISVGNPDSAWTVVCSF